MGPGRATSQVPAQSALTPGTVTSVSDKHWLDAGHYTITETHKVLARGKLCPCCTLKENVTMYRKHRKFGALRKSPPPRSLLACNPRDKAELVTCIGPSVPSTEQFRDLSTKPPFRLVCLLISLQNSRSRDGRAAQLVQPLSALLRRAVSSCIASSETHYHLHN